MWYIKTKTFDLFYKVWNKDEMRKRSKQYIDTYLEHSNRDWDVEYKEPFPFTNEEWKDWYRQFVVLNTKSHKTI